MKGFDVDPIAIWASDAPEASISSKESDTPKKYYFLIEYLSFFCENDLLSSESVVSSSSVMVTSRSTWS